MKLEEGKIFRAYVRFFPLGDFYYVNVFYVNCIRELKKLIYKYSFGKFLESLEILITNQFTGKEFIFNGL